MKTLDVSCFKDRCYSTLSGGERQRVNLARVLVQLGLFSNRTSKCLLLDEHVAHLDMHHQHESFSLIRRFIDRYPLAGIAVVHDINLAARYADQILVINNGEQYAYGDANKVLTKTMVKEVFNMQLEYIQAHQQYIVFPA